MSILIFLLLFQYGTATIRELEDNNINLCFETTQSTETLFRVLHASLSHYSFRPFSNMIPPSSYAFLTRQIQEFHHDMDELKTPFDYSRCQEEPYRSRVLSDVGKLDIYALIDRGHRLMQSWEQFRIDQNEKRRRELEVQLKEAELQYQRAKEEMEMLIEWDHNSLLLWKLPPSVYDEEKERKTRQKQRLQHVVQLAQKVSQLTMEIHWLSNPPF
jgi:hypothetical protein